MKPVGAQLAEHVEQRRVDELVLDHLDHDALGRQRQRPHREQELAREVDVRAVAADELSSPMSASAPRITLDVAVSESHGRPGYGAGRCSSS